jgi:hypothetical protein
MAGNDFSIPEMNLPSDIGLMSLPDIGNIDNAGFESFDSMIKDMNLGDIGQNVTDIFNQVGPDINLQNIIDASMGKFTESINNLQDLGSQLDSVKIPTESFENFDDFASKIESGEMGGQDQNFQQLQDIINNNRFDLSTYMNDLQLKAGDVWAAGHDENLQLIDNLKNDANAALDMVKTPEQANAISQIYSGQNGLIPEAASLSNGLIAGLTDALQTKISGATELSNALLNNTEKTGTYYDSQKNYVDLLKGTIIPAPGTPISTIKNTIGANGKQLTIDLTTKYVAPEQKLVTQTPKPTPTPTQAPTPTPFVGIEQTPMLRYGWQQVNWKGPEDFLKTLTPTTPAGPIPGVKPTGGEIIVHVVSGELTPGIVSGDYHFKTNEEATAATEAIRQYFINNAPKTISGNYATTATVSISGPTNLVGENPEYNVLGEKTNASQTIKVTPELSQQMGGTYKPGEIISMEQATYAAKMTTIGPQPETKVNDYVTYLGKVSELNQDQLKLITQESNQVKVSQNVKQLFAPEKTVTGPTFEPIQNTNAISQFVNWLEDRVRNTDDKAEVNGLLQKSTTIAGKPPTLTSGTTPMTLDQAQEAYGNDQALKADALTGGIIKIAASQALQGIKTASPTNILIGILSVPKVATYMQAGYSLEDARALADSNKYNLTGDGKKELDTMISAANKNGNLKQYDVAGMDEGEKAQFLLNYATPTQLQNLNGEKANEFIASTAMNPALMAQSITVFGADKINNAFDELTETTTNKLAQEAGMAGTLQAAKGMLQPRITGVPVVDMALLPITGVTGFENELVSSALEKSGISGLLDVAPALADLKNFAKTAEISVPSEGISDTIFNSLISKTPMANTEIVLAGNVGELAKVLKPGDESLGAITQDLGNKINIVREGAMDSPITLQNIAEAYRANPDTVAASLAETRITDPSGMNSLLGSWAKTPGIGKETANEILTHVNEITDIGAMGLSKSIAKASDPIAATNELINKVGYLPTVELSARAAERAMITGDMEGLKLAQTLEKMSEEAATKTVEAMNIAEKIPATTEDVIAASKAKYQNALSSLPKTELPTAYEGKTAIKPSMFDRTGLGDVIKNQNDDKFYTVLEKDANKGTINVRASTQDEIDNAVKNIQIKYQETPTGLRPGTETETQGLPTAKTPGGKQVGTPAEAYATPEQIALQPRPKELGINVKVLPETPTIETAVKSADFTAGKVTPSTIRDAIASIRDGKVDDALSVLRNVKDAKIVDLAAKASPDMMKGVRTADIVAMKDVGLAEDTMNALMELRSKQAIKELGEMGDIGKSIAGKTMFGDKMTTEEIKFALQDEKTAQTVVDARWTKDGREIMSNANTDIVERMNAGTLSKEDALKELKTLENKDEMMRNVICG